MHFKLSDIFVLTFAVAVLFALVVPAMMSAREAARLMAVLYWLHNDSAT